jgi:hypothetical protein
MAPGDLTALVYDFMHPQIASDGTIVESPYHPVQLHIVEGTNEYDPPNVMIRISGNTSWLQAILYDPDPKMQFQISFNKIDSNGRFENQRKIKLDMPRAEIIDLAVAELREFFPRAAGAVLERAHVVKEVRATFSARPDTEALRPPAATAVPNLFLAGDWTASGWPATMEGAVRSGYIAAEAVARAAGIPARYLLPDIA